MKVHHKKKSDGLRPHHERKSDGGRVHHDKDRWGESDEVRVDQEKESVGDES